MNRQQLYRLLKILFKKLRNKNNLQKLNRKHKTIMMILRYKWQDNKKKRKKYKRNKMWFINKLDIRKRQKDNSRKWPSCHRRIQLKNRLKWTLKNKNNRKQLKSWCKVIKKWLWIKIQIKLECRCLCLCLSHNIRCLCLCRCHNYPCLSHRCLIYQCHKEIFLDNLIQLQPILHLIPKTR